MAEFETCIVPFPRRPSPLHESKRSPLPVEATAELRATMLGNLLDQIAEPDGLQPENLRLRIAAYSALDLLDEMVVLYRRALSEARGGCQMNQGIMTCLSPHDGHPGMEIIWAADCRQAFNQGVKLAQTWLDNARSGWLWAIMIAERDLLPCALERRAFEVGFLSRIHQRICSHQGNEQQIKSLSLTL